MTYEVTKTSSKHLHYILIVLDGLRFEGIGNSEDLACAEVCYHLSGHFDLGLLFKSEKSLCSKIFQ